MRYYGICDGCGEEGNIERKRVDDGDVFIDAYLCFECRNLSVKELERIVGDSPTKEVV